MIDYKIFELTDLVKEDKTLPENDPFLKSSSGNTDKAGTFDLGKELSLEETLSSKETKEENLSTKKTVLPEEFSFTDDSQEENKQDNKNQFSTTPLNELNQELPLMMKKMLMPAIDEITNEIALSVKKMLPDLIEKVIREEIEKLKKIQS